MENNELNLSNFSVITSKIPDNLLKKLKKECLNFIEKEKMISDLTSLGVAEHYYLEYNNIELFNFFGEWVKKYDEKYSYIKTFNNHLYWITRYFRYIRF